VQKGGASWRVKLFARARRFLELTIRDSKFARSLDRAIGRLRTLGATLKNIGSLGISGGGLAGLQRALTLFAGSAALSWPVKLAADMEVAEAQFTALTGSAQKAREVLLDLQQFTAQTSLSFEQLTIAARNMLQFGVSVDALMPTLRALSAISIGNADQLDRLSVAFGQVQAKGRLMAEEVRQMVNAGFNPLQEISRTTGTSMRQLIKDMEAGRISAAQVAKSFESAVGPTGRFHGILALIENTATGQFRKLAAGIKIAVLPLGRELLPAITGILKKINELIPALQTFLRDNAAWAKTIAITVVGFSALLATLFGLGVAFQVVSFSATGLIGILALIFNPITLITAALGGAVAAFLHFTEIGQAALGGLKQSAIELLTVFQETMGGIADALAGGETALAAEVFWSGLRVAWLTGTQGIRQIWHEMVGFLAKTILSVGGVINVAWAQVVGAMERTWLAGVSAMVSVSDFFVDAWNIATTKVANAFTFLRGVVEAVFVAITGAIAFIRQAILDQFNLIENKAHLILARVQEQMDAITNEADDTIDARNKALEGGFVDRTAERDARDRAREAERQKSLREQEQQIARITADLEASLGHVDDATREKIDGAKKDLEDARKKFADAREKALDARLAKKGFEGKGGPLALDGIAEAAAASGIGARSTFSGKLAPQIFGGQDTIGKQLVNQGKKQIQLLDGIKDNTFVKKRGLFVGND
jgi:tape measure domain-containing protein